MLTFLQAKNTLAQFCGTGKYPDDETVGTDINMAVERLMNKPKNWTYTTQNLIMCAPNGQLTLPREVAKVIKCRVNGRFQDVQSRWYEYLSNGPGLLEDHRNSWLGPLIDRGFACTQYDIPTGVPMYLGVLSDRVEDDLSRMLIRGHDETGREVYGKNVFGEYVPIRGGTQDTMWITENLFTDITFIQKPATKGYVYISAILPTEGIRYHLGSIHPDETEPRYRRYFIRETRCCSPVSTTGTFVSPTPHRIDALCRLQYVPALHDSDVLMIQNTGALKMMLKALRLEDAEKLKEAQEYEATAERLLNEQTSMMENDEDMIDIMKEGFGIGQIEDV
jgi:hypothetical protein